MESKQQPVKHIYGYQRQLALRAEEDAREYQAYKLQSKRAYK